MPDLMLYEYRDLPDAELKQMLGNELRNIIKSGFAGKVLPRREPQRQI